MQYLLLLLCIFFGFLNRSISAMEKKKPLIKPLNLSETQIASIKKQKKNSPHFPDKTRKYSPNRFQNSEIRRNESNLQNAYEFKEFLEFVNDPIIDSRKKEFIQFRLAEHLHTQFEKFNTLAAADGEPISPEKSKHTKEIVHKLGSNYYYNLGKYYFSKAQNKLENAEREENNSEEQINFLQQAHHFGSKATVCFKDSLEIKPTESAKNLHYKTEIFLKELTENFQLLPNYQGALKVTKEAYSSEEAGKKRQVEAFKTSNNTEKMKNLQKKEYMKQLDNAEQKFIEAALKYLKASEKILDPLILTGAQRSLEEAYKIQRLKLEENKNAAINPIVGEISRRINQGFKKIQDREESSSSSTISTASSSEHYLGSKEKLF